MNLTKAMEILEAIRSTAVYDGDPDDSNAVKLGREALERLEDIRKDGYPRDLYPLPGETEE